MFDKEKIIAEVVKHRDLFGNRRAGIYVNKAGDIELRYREYDNRDWMELFDFEYFQEDDCTDEELAMWLVDILDEVFDFDSDVQINS